MGLVLFDTNIFIDMLHGVSEATSELNRYEEPAISYISYLELECGVFVRPEHKAVLDNLLPTFELIHMNEHIMQETIQVRGNSLIFKPKIALPDAIIQATANVYMLTVITRNAKHFARARLKPHVPYDYDSGSGRVSNVRAPWSPTQAI